MKKSNRKCPHYKPRSTFECRKKRAARHHKAEARNRDLMREVQEVLQ